MGKSKWWTTGRRLRRSHEPLCRFEGCDATATATVGTVALCALHRSFIDSMLDHGVAATEAAPVASDPSAD